MKKLLLTSLVLILFGNLMYAQYNSLRIESEEEYLERQIRIAKLKRELEDAKNGRNLDYNSNQTETNRTTFNAEIHECSNNGYHNTSYEHHCFDMYFYSNGTIFWNRRRFSQVRYNDTLNGSYYLVETRKNRYKLYITWSNGNKQEGIVEYNNSRPVIHIYGHVFDAQ